MDPWGFIFLTGLFLWCWKAFSAVLSLPVKKLLKHNVLQCVTGWQCRFFVYEFIFFGSSYVSHPGFFFFSVKQAMDSYNAYRYSLGKVFDVVNNSKHVFFSMQSRSQPEVENTPVNFMEEGVFIFSTDL